MICETVQMHIPAESMRMMLFWPSTTSLMGLAMLMVNVERSAKFCAANMES